MKKSTVKILAVIFLAATLCTVITSCASTLSGEYYSGDKTNTMSYTSYVFSGERVVYSEYLAGFLFNTYEAEYIIKNGNITLNWTDSKGEHKTKTQAFSELEDGSIRIGAVTYKKG